MSEKPEILSLRESIAKKCKVLTRITFGESIGNNNPTVISKVKWKIADKSDIDKFTRNSERLN